MKLSAYDDFSEKLKVLGHPIRLRIALALMDKEYPVSALCSILNIPQATASQHLSILRVRGIVKGVRNGTSISYQMNSEPLKDLLLYVQAGVAELSKKRKRIPSRKAMRT